MKPYHLASLDRLRAIAAYFPVFDAPDFEFATWTPPKERDGVVSLRGYTLSATAQDFLRTADDAGWVVQFDWGTWIGTDEAARLRDDPNALSHATPGQLAKLLTVVVRQNRFVEGELVDAFESGLLVGILRRADALVREAERDGFLGG